MTKLNTVQQFRLTFLRQQVDAFERETFKRGAQGDALRDLHRAREELRKYVEALREEGHNV